MAEGLACPLLLRRLPKPGNSQPEPDLLLRERYEPDEAVGRRCCCSPPKARLVLEVEKTSEWEEEVRLPQPAAP